VKREAIIDALHAENILVRKYFWPGCHRMKPYSDLFPRAGMQLMNTEFVSRKVIVLPNGGAITPDHVKVMAQVISLVSNLRYF